MSNYGQPTAAAPPVPQNVQALIRSLGSVSERLERVRDRISTAADSISGPVPQSATKGDGAKIAAVPSSLTGELNERINYLHNTLDQIEQNLARLEAGICG